MNNERQYPNRADKIITLWLVFVAVIALHVAVAVGVILNLNNVSFEIGFAAIIGSFFVVMIPFGILVSKLSAPKRNTVRGKKTYDYMMEVFERNKENVIIKNIDGIDNLLITPYGVYAISSVSFEGRIYGMDSEDYWRQSFAFKKKKNRLDNPAKAYLDTVTKFKKKHNLSLDIEPALVLLSNNRGHLISKVMYAPGELKYLVNINGEKVLSEKDIETLGKKLA